MVIFNQGGNRDLKLIVRLQTEPLIARVNRLVAGEKWEEAFRFILKNAEVEEYIPPGRKIKVRPELTLVEDAL